MTGVLSIILVLAGLIFFHEMGHFICARLVGVGVRSVSIGFGKPLLQWRGKKTNYRLSLIPLGGYADLVGMRAKDELEPPFSKEDAYYAKSPLKRLLAVAGGPFFNFVLAWLLYWGLFWSGSALILPELGAVRPDSAAAEAGLAPGDIITGINERDIASWDDLLYEVQSGQGAVMLVRALRGERELSFVVAPRPFTLENGRVAYLMGVAASMRFVERPFFTACLDALRETWNKTVFIGQMVAGLFSRPEELTENLGGPVMVAQTVHQQATHAGLAGVLKITALLSINLGLLNLLPIPALDGGHIIFNLLELVFRRPVPERIQAACTYCGFVLLIGLMLAVTALDVLRLTG